MNSMDTTIVGEKSYCELHHPVSDFTGVSLPDLTFEVFEDFESVVCVWQELERQATCTPFQTYAWSYAWHRHVRQATKVLPQIVVGTDKQGKVQIILAFGLFNKGPVRVLEWLAGNHATYCGGLYHPGFESGLDAAQIQLLWSEITRLLPPFDVACLMAQMPTLDGETDQIAHLGAVRSASPYFCISLDENWEKFHSQRRSGETRRSERKRERKLGRLGPLHFAAHTQGHALEQATEEMFQQRSARFAEQGIYDYLGDPGVADFYRSLTQLTDKKDGIEGFVTTLSVGGTIVSCVLNIIFNNKNYALVTSITSDEAIRKLSPGEILMRHTLKHCCERGLASYDCGGGFDIYKDSWADRRFHTFDTILPQTGLGTLYAGGLNGFLAAKAHIKQSPALWNTFKKIRKWGLWS